MSKYVILVYFLRSVKIFKKYKFSQMSNYVVLVYFVSEINVISPCCSVRDNDVRILSQEWYQ